MRKLHFLFLFLFVFSPLCFGVSAAQASDDKTLPNDSDLSPDQMKEKIELLKLENENLKLKLQLKNQEAASVSPSSAVTPANLQPSPSPTPTSNPKNEEADLFRAESRRAAELAKSHKSDTDLLVLDTMNNEVWYKGARFPLSHFTDLADQEGWKYTSRIVAMNGTSHARNLYQCKNLSFLIYDGEEKGIFTFKAPEQNGDLNFMTPEGLSNGSGSENVRNADFKDFYQYDGMDKRDGKNVLKYKHDRFLAFSDEMEFFFNSEDKMTQFRFGLLGEK